MILVYLTVVSTSKDFEPQDIVRTFFVDSFWEQVDYYVSLAYIDKHVIFKNNVSGLLTAVSHLEKVHLLEDTEAYAQVFDVVALPLWVLTPGLWLCKEPYLEVLSSVLFRSLLVSRRDDKVIHDYRVHLLVVDLVVGWCLVDLVDFKHVWH